MLIQTQNKYEAIEALLRTIVLDNTLYCNNCNADFNPAEYPCCGNPQLGRHAEHLRAVVKQNKEIQASLKNDYASGDTKALRWGVSLPPRVFFILEECFKRTYNEKLFKNQKDLHGFMRHFKAFCIPKNV